MSSWAMQRGIRPFPSVSTMFAYIDEVWEYLGPTGLSKKFKKLTQSQRALKEAIS